MSKIVNDKIFKRKSLKKINLGDICVKIDMYRILKQSKNYSCSYNIQTTDNDNFIYSDDIISKRSISATHFDTEEKITKTQIIEIFAKLSIHDVWCMEFKIYDNTTNWPTILSEKIKKMEVTEASEYIKNNFQSFGKIERKMIGQKVEMDSDNNYYLVRDLTIHFELLDKNSQIETAYKQSIRKVDVNSINYLIFNSVKYIVKQ